MDVNDLRNVGYFAEQLANVREALAELANERASNDREEKFRVSLDLNARSHLLVTGEQLAAFLDLLEADFVQWLDNVGVKA